MNILQELIISLFMGILFVFMFKKAAGTLSIKRLNAMSLAFYMILVFCYIGGTIVYCGFRDHYLIEKVEEKYIAKTYFTMCYAIIMLPVVMCIVNRLMGIRNYKLFFDNYVAKEVVESPIAQSTVYKLTVILTLFGAGALFYTFYCIGYIPIIELLRGNFALMANRVLISRDFQGNEYIRNIFALGMVPYLSYLAYVYYRVTKERRWKRLFFILFIMSVMVKTYAFEKSPVIYYVGYFYLIEVVLGNVNKIGKAMRYGIFGMGVILFVYYVMLDYQQPLFTLQSGPIGRILMTQIACLFLHIQTFPKRTPYLGGRSFSGSIGALIGRNDFGIRSGRVVMEIYNRSGIVSGTAGVMNTLYIGEAYANWGIHGAILAPIIVGIVMAFFPNYILKQEKDPLNITLYILFVITFNTSLLGGFVDFVFNIVLIVLFLVFLVLRIIRDGGKIIFRRVW